ncbi:uncharacterized protein LOC124142943 [Haliotis rufescens]|uniref:uncharacterized protein LOC124142943 n=1 Tax=Haliotis rufescens TaxID=6454 RepID=UPI00201F9A89|nr:uncharacterized protein LOC124142943 [Haliotis rufescens]
MNRDTILQAYSNMSRWMASLSVSKLYAVCLIVSTGLTLTTLIRLELTWVTTSGRRARPRSLALCPNVLSGMSRGRWVPRNVSLMERQKLDAFVSTVRKQYKLPVTMQREDGRCGVVSYSSGIRDHSVLRYFRAMCDPSGRNPCCRGTMCQEGSREECRCPECYDLRQDVHAELASWETDDPRCGLRVFRGEEACRLLAGSTLLVAGDSLMRQLYVALLLILAGNVQDGALGNDIPDDMRTRCSGMNQFTDKECRRYIVTDTAVCNGSVKIGFRVRTRAVYVQTFLSDIRTLTSIGRSIVLVGFGQHDTLSVPFVKSQFLLPVLKYMKSAMLKWPRIIWASVHAFGVLAFAPERNATLVRDYNRQISELLTTWGVPVMDTFNMTLGTVSVDGVHYGQGVNMAKAQLFFNYLFEEKLKFEW